MGLDMYAFATTKAPRTPVDFPERDEDVVLHQWRKHPNLHGWMEALYWEKGGLEEAFNLATVVLDCADLDRLESDIRANRLPDTDGFFFGRSDGSEIDDDLAFVNKARQAIAAGLTVYFTSWW